ncbi:type II toxin-antitoxin system Phd/YefM family antitoxin [Nocardia caishijiensis]|uniref:Antitoxin (DNA-binding transcriptional repressor) of toxin-antitoxin stability system n=1 Tax=Nocardia caishijiensis TaxID=184756 RepID=A0ABQ6YTN3_9NOCA|nr:hypothetical protein [Nocardia caishijiensis]KAF0849164.1 antitoxin (DNA-binding transcriptional repressor) of toxin-antitoxin stability system [Nocardia caishijiensis]
MKSISADELGQHLPTVVADVEAGEVYELTRHNHRIGFIVPAVSSTQIIPRKVAGAADTSATPRHTLRTADAVDELLETDKGEW